MQEIYLDYAAATPVDERVLEAMLPFFTQHYGNPGSLHVQGQNAAAAVQKSRQSIAKLLSCFSNEIIFTGSGTESVNLALQGVALSLKHKGNHIITQATEHHAVLHTLQHLESQGFSVTYLKPDRFGLITPEQVAAFITSKTILCSVMYANNEIGTIQPIKQIAQVCQKSNVLFHSDACQAAGLLPLNVRELGVDLLSLDSSKVYGPKGIGLLYVRSGVQLTSLLFGGEQESKHRPGTENVAAIIGFAKALEISELFCKQEVSRLIELRDFFVKELLALGCTLNGHPINRLANNVSVIFPHCEAESFVLRLSEHGICASTGSACTSRTMKSSHVLAAIGLSQDKSHAAVRFTLGRYTTREEIAQTLKIVKELVRPVKVLAC